MRWIQNIWEPYIWYYGPSIGKSIYWWSSNAKNITESFGAVAVIVGGFSAYLRFFYGQTFFYRIDPKISSEVISTPDRSFIKIKVEAKNVGTVACHLARANTIKNEKFDCNWWQTLKKVVS